MDDPLYREIILDHWKNPHNAGVITDADIDVSDVNILCGDVVRITVKLSNKHIADIRFLGEGCAISQASTSILTDLIKNNSIDELIKIKENDFLEELGITLTPARLKCALLGFNVLKKGVSSIHL